MTALPQPGETWGNRDGALVETTTLTDRLGIVLLGCEVIKAGYVGPTEGFLYWVHPDGRLLRHKTTPLDLIKEHDHNASHLGPPLRHHADR